MKDRKPGDFTVRIGFGREFGGGEDQGMLKPSLAITDGTSRLTLTLKLSAADIAEMLNGSEVRIDAEQVTGFQGVKNWGKYHRHATRTVKTEPGDYKFGYSDGEAIRKLPHIAPIIAELEADGYRVVGTPSRDNSGLWQITGRRYDDQPPE